MILLLRAQALVGMLLVTAMLRPRKSIRPAFSEESAQVLRSKIHLMSSRTDLAVHRLARFLYPPI
jgi:hypothetical protein